MLRAANDLILAALIPAQEVMKNHRRRDGTLGIVARGSLLHFPHCTCLMAPTVSLIALLPTAVLLAFLRNGRFARSFARSRPNGWRKHSFGIVIYNAVYAPFAFVRQEYLRIKQKHRPTVVDARTATWEINSTDVRDFSGRRQLHPRGKITRASCASS